MKAKHIQPLTIMVLILGALFFVRAFLPKPALNTGNVMQSGSFTGGVSSTSGRGTFKGQY